MQKRTMKNTFSNKGESYIPVCVLVLFLSALVSVLILYIGTMAQVQAQKRDVKTKLDSVVSEYATEMFDAIKQGAPSEQYIDYDGLVRKTYARLGFPSDTVSPSSSASSFTTKTRSPLWNVGSILSPELGITKSACSASDDSLTQIFSGNSDSRKLPVPADAGKS